MTACRVSHFGNLSDGREVHVCELTNANGMVARVLTYGGSLQYLSAPDRQGQFANVTLGYETLADYLRETAYAGAIVGRYANRIAGASFELNGKTYQLSANESGKTLHGGAKGFDKALWQIKESSSTNQVTLSLVSPDGDQGFPGDVTIEATYKLDDSNALSLHFTARTTQSTPFSLAPHGYWNLSGDFASDILSHVMQLSADRYLPVNEVQIPTGEWRDVAGTAFDFRAPRQLGDCLRSTGDAQIEAARGLDHNFVLEGKGLATIAVLVDPTSGRRMTLSSDAPGLQIYSGNYLTPRWSAIALEPQQFPDAPNQPDFPSAILNPGEIWQSTSIFAFDIAPVE